MLAEKFYNLCDDAIFGFDLVLEVMSVFLQMFDFFKISFFEGVELMIILFLGISLKSIGLLCQCVLHLVLDVMFLVLFTQIFDVVIEMRLFLSRLVSFSLRTRTTRGCVRIFRVGLLSRRLALFERQPSTRLDLLSL